MRTDHPVARRFARMSLALVVAGCASSAFAAAPSAQQAHAVWQKLIQQTPAPSAGCFHAAYPSAVWIKGACTPAVYHRMIPPQRPDTVHRDNVGNGNDDVLTSATPISQTVGSFPQVSNVNRERSVGVALFGGGGILGPNEYNLQINSQANQTSAACNGHAGCTIWQQFIYATDYNQVGNAEVFIQYWLLGYNAACPTGWWDGGGGDCYVNSGYADVPDVPITQLGNETLTGIAVAGGNDTATFTVGDTAYTVSAPDSMLDLASVWNQSEFNVIGGDEGARAVFNPHSSVAVQIAVNNGSTAAPTCTANAGTTGETNNLNLQSCAAYGGATPNIVFVESN